MAVFQNLNRPYRNRKNLFSPEDDTLVLPSLVFVVKRDSKLGVSISDLDGRRIGQAAKEIGG
jgi:hypothetical protein